MEAAIKPRAKPCKTLSPSAVHRRRGNKYVSTVDNGCQSGNALGLLSRLGGRMQFAAQYDLLVAGAE